MKQLTLMAAFLLMTSVAISAFAAGAGHTAPRPVVATTAPHIAPATSVVMQIHLLGRGATFPGEIYGRWITEYEKLHPDVQIDYQLTGSGAGIKGITAKSLDFGSTDAPMSHREMERAGGEDSLIEIPTVAGAVVLSYNIPGFKGDLKFDGITLADIYLGHVKKWNDPKITALNMEAHLPDLPITIVYRSDSSGTNFIFTHYLCEQSEDFYNRVGPSKRVTWPVGTGAQGNEGVVQLVSTTRGAMGYVDLTVASKHHLPFALLKNKEGQFVKATPESISAAGDAAANELQGDILAGTIWDQDGQNVYPISSFTYLLFYKDLTYLKDPSKAKALADFLNWAATDGQVFASDLHYAPLGPAVQQSVRTALSHITGTEAPTSSPLDSTAPPK